MAEQIKVRTALLTNLLQDVESFMQDETLCDSSNPLAAPKSVACKKLLESLFKKWPEDDERAETKALLTFLEANSSSRTWAKPPSLMWDGEFAETWGMFKRELDIFLHRGPEPIIPNEREIASHGKVGPGAAIEAACTSFYGKMGCSELTATSIGLYTIYRDYVSEDSRWTEMENIREVQNDTLHIVSGSKVSFAPKNADTARLICTEPSVNMYLQLGLCALLEDRMRTTWNVVLDGQPDFNRLLARKGSLGDGYATIDLSSASDYISMNLAQEAFPSWFYELLQDLRSPCTQVKSYGLDVELGCISTMGNGFTFPVMTMLLSCAVRACYVTLGIPIKDNWGPSTHEIVHPGNWAVFGDDIIVREEAYDYVVSFLAALGLRVNEAKSFHTGPFRESCGHDYFNGHSVRGVYLKRLASRRDITVAVNRLNDWTFRTGVPLCRGVQYLVSLIGKVLYVPYAEGEDAGIRVPSCIFRGVQRRFKACYESSRAVATKVRIGDGVVITPNGSKRLMYNQAAAWLSFLLGELRDGSLIIRQNNGGGRYQTRWCVTPNWDYMPSSVWVNPRVDWLRWETAVWTNITVGPDLKA